MEIQLWREILNPYELAVKEVMTKFNHLIKEHRDRGLYSPIEQVEGRVKTISSMLEKCQKKKIDLEDIEERISDLAGVRVICQFVEDIDKVVEISRNRKDMEIKQERDYIREMKSSGYRSYHMIIYYTVDTLDGPKTVSYTHLDVYKRQIPRGSGNEEAVSRYCMDFAEKRGLTAYRDESNNVIITKESSKGYENAPGVILQGHLDMVCEKNADCTTDFTKDGINVLVDGDFVRADGTTLGGDDGIAVAMMLAILDDDSLSHPRLECVFTLSLIHL